MFSKKESYSLKDDPCDTFPEPSMDMDDKTEKGFKISDANNKQIAANSGRYDSILGMFYAFLSSLFYEITAVIVKQLSYINPVELSIARNIGIFCGGLPIAIYCYKKILGEREDRIMLCLRALSYGACTYMAFITYRNLPLVEAALILSMTPMITTAMARIYLKESCGFFQILSLVLSLIGVMSTIRVPEQLHSRNYARFDSTYYKGLAAAVAAVFLTAVTSVALRKIKHVHFSVKLTYTGFLGAVELSVINAAVFPYVSAYCGWDQLLFVAIAVMGFMGNFGSTKATEKQPAGVATVAIASFDILTIVLIQAVFYCDYPDAYVACGTFFVIVSLIITGIQSWVQTLPDETERRKKLNWLLY